MALCCADCCALAFPTVLAAARGSLWKHSGLAPSEHPAAPKPSNDNPAPAYKPQILICWDISAPEV